MITLSTNPRLIDFLLICELLRPNERAQIEALWGLPYDFERAASFCYNLPDPKWVGLSDGKPVAAGGFLQQRPGVWEIWLAGTDAAWAQPIAMTRLARTAMRAMFESGAHRLQHTSLASDTAAHSWYRSIGLKFEGKMAAWGSKGEDALMFACTEKP